MVGVALFFTQVILLFTQVFLGRAYFKLADLERRLDALEGKQAKGRG